MDKISFKRSMEDIHGRLFRATPRSSCAQSFSEMQTMDSSVLRTLRWWAELPATKEKFSLRTMEDKRGRLKIPVILVVYIISSLFRRLPMVWQLEGSELRSGPLTEERHGIMGPALLLIVSFIGRLLRL